MVLHRAILLWAKNAVPAPHFQTVLVLSQEFTFCVLSLSLWLSMRLSKHHLLQIIPNLLGLSAGLGAWLALQVKQS